MIAGPAEGAPAAAAAPVGTGAEGWFRIPVEPPNNRASPASSVSSITTWFWYATTTRLSSGIRPPSAWR